MTEIFPEVQAAAKWWADIMSAANVRQDNGDGFQSGFAMLSRNSVAPLNADERSVFERILCDRLQEYVTREFGGWNEAKDKGDPHWASACRTVGVDYGPDQVLAGAGARVAGGDSRQEARISLLWPIKTHMWIDPGEVRVKHGYGAQAQRIYPVESATAQNAEASSDALPGDGGRA